MNAIAFVNDQHKQLHLFINKVKTAVQTWAQNVYSVSGRIHVLTKTTVCILSPKQYYCRKSYITIEEIYQSNNKVAITAGNEATPTTFESIEFEKAVR